MVIQKNCEFITDLATPIVSKVFSNTNGDVLTLSVYGATGLCHLEGRNTSKGDWVSLAGINLNDLSATKGGITKPGIYEFGIVGIRELRVKLEKADGNISVFGQIISTEET